MPVHVEVSHVAVQALAHQIGQPTYRQDVSRPVKRHAIIEVQPLSPLPPSGLSERNAASSVWKPCRGLFKGCTNSLIALFYSFVVAAGAACTAEEATAGSGAGTTLG